MKALLTLLPLLAYAQGVTGPRSGFVFDAQAKAIRPVNGIPGAATLGEPLDLGGLTLDQVEFGFAGVAYAIASGRVYRISLNNPKAEIISGTLPDARLAAGGVLWSPSTRTLQFLTDGRQVLVNADGNLTAAVLTGVNCAILAFDSGAVESLCDNNQLRIYDDQTVTVTALAVTHDAIFALAGNRILELSPELKTISSGIQLVGLTAVNNVLLAVADANQRNVTFISLNDNPAPSPVNLLFKPKGLRHLDTDILQLGDAGLEPFEVIDLNQQNRNFFIPAIVTATISTTRGGQN